MSRFANRHTSHLIKVMLGVRLDCTPESIACYETWSAGVTESLRLNVVDLAGSERVTWPYDSEWFDPFYGWQTVLVCPFLFDIFQNFIPLWPRSRSQAQRACDFRKPPTSIAVYWPLGCSSRWFPSRKLVQTKVICRSHVKNIWGTPKRWLIHAYPMLAPEGLTFQSLTSFMLSSMHQ